MLLKASALTHVDKPRTILLLEVDYNFNNTKLGRDVRVAGDNRGLITPKQLGGSKSTAVDQSLNRRLTFDIIRLLGISASVCSNDTKSCYDSIPHVITSLASQRFGLLIEP